MVLLRRGCPGMKETEVSVPSQDCRRREEDRSDKAFLHLPCQPGVRALL